LVVVEVASRSKARRCVLLLLSILTLLLLLLLLLLLSHLSLGGEDWVGEGRGGGRVRTIGEGRAIGINVQVEPIVVVVVRHLEEVRVVDVQAEALGSQRRGVCFQLILFSEQASERGGWNCRGRRDSPTLRPRSVSEIHREQQR